MTDARTQLLQVLHEAASQDIGRMSQAEQLLKQWENEPSFFATLQVLSAARDAKDNPFHSP